MVAGGQVPTVLDSWVQPRIFTLAFHSEAFTVTIDPYNPPLFQSARIAGCNGTAQLVLKTWQHVVHLDVDASPRSFVEVTCPNKDGFMVRRPALLTTKHVQAEPRFKQAPCSCSFVCGCAADTTPMAVLAVGTPLRHKPDWRLPRVTHRLLFQRTCYD